MKGMATVTLFATRRMLSSLLSSVACRATMKKRRKPTSGSALAPLIKMVAVIKKVLLFIWRCVCTVEITDNLNACS